MQIEVRTGDILAFEGDAIILPTLSDGSMQEGIAAAVREIVGGEVEEQVRAHAPIAVGAAFVTEAPGLGVRHLIHVPLIEESGMRVGIENIRRATRAGLLGATRLGLDSVAIPGIGYGETGVPHDEAARAIVDEAMAYRGPHPTSVVLVDQDERMVAAFDLQTQEVKR
ncbi:MAG: macro domain-containing protein [Myxococcales bacterium]|nr:macro domain-containing protein [Myxococcales bacterium]